MGLNRYQFALPTSIYVGEGIVEETGAKARELGGTKALLVAGDVVTAAGLTAPVEASLTRAGIPYVTYNQIVSNPRDVHCQAGYQFAREKGVDILVAVGGGSCIDTAKAIGILLANGKTIQDWWGYRRLEREITPLIAIPTTAGTGSEVTPFVVVTETQTHIKQNILDPKVAAKVALIDPTVLRELPSHIMAATGIDALTHAVESYTCKVATPHTEAHSLYAIRQISKYLRKAVLAPDMESLTGMMLGSSIAGIAFGYADVAAVHCMSEALGGRYDMAHGVANAVLLPTVTEYNIPADPQKHADVAQALGINTAGMSPEEAALEGASELRRLCADVGIPKMRDLNRIDPADFPQLAQAAEQNVSTSSNPRKVGAKEFLYLFRKAYQA